MLRLYRRVERLMWARYGDAFLLATGKGRYDIVRVDAPHSRPPWATTIVLSGTLLCLERTLLPGATRRERAYAKHGGYAAYMRQQKQQKREAGICVECSVPADGGTIRCARHNESRNANRRAKRAAVPRRAAGEP